jgi:hypothetical protein
MPASATPASVFCQDPVRSALRDTSFPTDTA